MMFTAYMRKRIKHLNQLAGRDLTGSHEVKGSNKYDWLHTGHSVLRAMAKQLRLVEFKAHMNPGGPAVSGDITLAGKWGDGSGIFVCMSEPRLFGMNEQPQFYYRAARDGWQEGPNQFCIFQALADDPEAACREISRRVR